MASSKAMATTNEHLPEDVTLEILYRMTMKPLIRFSCSSKRWRSIISDPLFARTHFNFASERDTLTQRLLVSTRCDLKSLDVQTPSFLDDSSITNFTCPFKQPWNRVQILGSCNGMVCLALDSYDGYFIWNPCTGRSLKLPNPGFVSQVIKHFENFNPVKLIETLFNCGFGYVSANNDYKVIVGALFSYDSMPLEMFSSRANSWKVIEPHEHLRYVVEETKGALLDEALHWITDFYHLGIIAFDLAKEEYQNIPLPLIDQNGDGQICLFADVEVVFEGYLCVSGYDRDNEMVQVWVMMEYGVCESWTMFFQFSMISEWRTIWRPVFQTDSSMVFRKCKSWNAHNRGEGDELMKFNHPHDDYEDCSGQYTFAAGNCDMVRYDETLLWLNDHVGVEENVEKLGTQQGASTSNNVEE